MADTALALVQSDPYVERIEEAQAEGAGLAERAGALQITDEASDALANEMIAAATKAIKAIEEERVAVTGPINAGLSKINAMAKKAKEPYETVKSVLVAAHNRWADEQREKARKADEAALAKQRAAQAKLNAAAAEKGEDAPIVAPIQPKVQAPAKTITTDAGTTTWLEIRRARIVDETKIPRKFWNFDEKAIQAVYKAGGDVPGCEAYIERVPRTR
jgi:hypothetical protein